MAEKKLISSNERKRSLIEPANERLGIGRQCELINFNNTHTTAAFYECLPASEAFALAQRFEFYYTPKAASWLNMIEIEFSTIARACLHGRTPTQAQLETQVLALISERAEKKIKIHWQFSIQTARSKFNAHYRAAHPDNALYHLT